LLRDPASSRREEIIADGLAIGDAEDLCASKIEALRTTASMPMLELDRGRKPSIRLRRRVRQLAFRFE
jgi:hypothetical protein